jgi:hypothetical protein
MTSKMGRGMVFVKRMVLATPEEDRCMVWEPAQNWLEVPPNG